MVNAARARRREAIAWIVAGIGAVVLAIAVVTFFRSSGWGYDYLAYLNAARRLVEGEGIYLRETLEGSFSPGPFGLYLYAPPFAIAMTPFLLPPYELGVVLFLLLRIGLLVLACALMPVPRQTRLLAFGIACVTAPILSDLNLGNISVIVLFLQVVTWRWLGRPAGSAALAVALSVRSPMALVLVVWFLRRRVLPILWTLLAGAVLIAVTLPVVGIATYVEFVSVLRNIGELAGVPNNVDLASAALLLGLPLPVAQAAYAFGAAAALGALLFATFRRDGEVAYVTALGASLVLAPLLWAHYLATLLIPAALLHARGVRWGILLPLLGWLPNPLLGMVALAGTLATLLAPRPAPAADDPDTREPLPAPAATAA